MVTEIVVSMHISSRFMSHTCASFNQQPADAHVIVPCCVMQSAEVLVIVRVDLLPDIALKWVEQSLHVIQVSISGTLANKNQLASVHRRYPPWRATVYIRAMLLTPTLTRHFRHKFWPHEKTEPLLIPFKAWAFTWYRYCPASTVPLREKCTESLCDVAGTYFQTPFPTKISAARKNWTLIITVWTMGFNMV